MATIEEMVAAVKAYAESHYNEGGWDTIVECYDDRELASEIMQGKCQTNEEAIAYVGRGCKVYDDYRKDIQAEAF